MLLRGFDPLVRRYFVGVALSALGSGLTLPFLFVYLAQVRDIPTATVGLVFAWMGVVGLLTTPLCGTLVDRVGPRRVVLGASGVQAVAAVLLTQVDSTRDALLVTSLTALGHAWIWPASNAMTSRMVEPRLRQHLFGLSFMLMNAGLGVGGLLSATLVDVDRPGSFQLLYVLDALTFLGFLAVVASLPASTGQAPAPDDDLPAAAGGWAEALRDPALRRVSLLLLAMVSVGYAQIEAGFAAFVTEVAELPAWVLGPAFAANTAAIVATQVFALRFMDGRRRTRMLALCAVVWSAAWALVSLSGVLPTAAAIAAVVVGLGVFGLGETLFSPLGPAILNDLAPEHLRGRYNAVGTGAWTVAMIIGPALAGLLIGHGLALLWVLVTVGGTAATALVALRLREHLTDVQDGVRADADVRAPGPAERA